MATDAEGDQRRVILLAGPSGSGKSTIVRSVGLPMVYLDDFYRAGTDPTLPRHPELDRWKNLVRRAARDLKDRRKPPGTILRRGMHLYRVEQDVVDRATAAGCRPLGARDAREALTRARSHPLTG